jgi:hypothetical protein
MTGTQDQLLPTVLGRRNDPAIHAPTFAGAVSVVLSMAGFLPVWDLAGALGSTGWGLWVAALGVTLLIRKSPKYRPRGRQVSGYPDVYG